jgi:ribonuclease III
VSAPSRPPPAPSPLEIDPSSDPVSALEARLGLRIADRALALAALTHKSYVNEHRAEPGLIDNERLEFLGDAVIDLAVSHRLMQRFPGAREGDLSKMRAAVVDEQGLSEMARGLELGQLLRVGRGEELTGGRQKASLLSDALEAVVAAVYVAQGLEPVLTIVDRFLGEAFARAAAGTLDRDYKTQLQELAQSRFRATPRYRVVAEHGPDHAKLFEVEIDLRGEGLGRGTGRSKKDAEQAAAKLALDQLGRRVGDAAAATHVPAAPAAPPATPVVPPEPAGAPGPSSAAASERATEASPANEGESRPPEATEPEPPPAPPPARRRRAIAKSAAAPAAKRRRATGAAKEKSAAKPSRRGTRAKR